MSRVPAPLFHAPLFPQTNPIQQTKPWLHKNFTPRQWARAELANSSSAAVDSRQFLQSRQQTEAAKTVQPVRGAHSRFLSELDSVVIALRGLCPKKVSGTFALWLARLRYTIGRVPDTFFGQSPLRVMNLRRPRQATRSETTTESLREGRPWNPGVRCGPRRFFHFHRAPCQPRRRFITRSVTTTLADQLAEAGNHRPAPVRQTGTTWLCQPEDVRGRSSPIGRVRASRAARSQAEPGNEAAAPVWATSVT